MSEESNITLPFLELKQNALLGHLLINEKFFNLVHQKVKPEWFLGVKNSQVYKLLIETYEAYGRLPKIYELKNSTQFVSLEPKERKILSSFVDLCIHDTAQIRLETIKPDLTEWLHSVILLNALKEAEKHYNAKSIKLCHEKLMAAVRNVSDTTFDGGNSLSFGDYMVYLDEAQNERKEALTSGLSLLDQSLLKGSTHGGLQKGDTTLILAAVNVGKSSFLITTMCHNIRKGKDVLYLTHEGRPEDLRLKILANMLNCSIPGIFKLYKTEEGRQKLHDVTQIIERHLKYIPYNKAGMVVEQVVPIIRMAQEQWMADHNGKGFDMLVDDYPQILGTELAKKGNLQKRNSDQIVYSNFVQLGLEYGWHNLLAIQTNREGSRINRGQGEDRLLTSEDVLESWGPITEATNVITLNRGPEDIKNQVMKLYIVKSRSSETGMVVIAKTDFSKATTHSEILGATSYMGTRNNEDKVKELLAQFQHSNDDTGEIE